MALTPIKELINDALPANLQFKPTREFYKSVGINKHRFSKILKGDLEPQRNELQAIACHFNIPVSKLL
ncbi:hypothetical protein [Larkinella humicola]|uniref:HTH cro/C1-type domain-containing protein n=1 Tax=Larkinella humicola TaxID=2607654 RepID=A0A5N1JD43_9BACT|nr:hypothetical protein [Larkinella humicola]KAA9349724.1 hypothetical protein F0P93_19935 [Larkinella humicola]